MHFSYELCSPEKEKDSSGLFRARGHLAPADGSRVFCHLRLQFLVSVLRTPVPTTLLMSSTLPEAQLHCPSSDQPLLHLTPSPRDMSSELGAYSCGPVHQKAPPPTHCSCGFKVSLVSPDVMDSPSAEAARTVCVSPRQSPGAGSSETRWRPPRRFRLAPSSSSLVASHWTSSTVRCCVIVTLSSRDYPRHQNTTALLSKCEERVNRFW